MQSRFLLQVVLTLSLLILSRANDVIGPGYSCFRRSVDDDGQTRVTFLREDDAPGVRLLYLTVWSHDLRLVTCQVHTNPLVVARYRTLCDRSGTQGQKLAQSFNISALVASDAPCVPKFTRRSRRDGTRGKARRKRAWIMPGTLWCGKGSDAVKYEQLGMFENTDRCCREHDHCLHIIPAFRVNYGVFNPNFYAVSHCECDQRFRQCLLGVNDTISAMVGYSFFNILRIPCFELKQQRQCTEMYWWGMCKVAKEAPYAVFKSPLPYNTSDTKSNVALGDIIDSSKSTSDGQHITERPTVKLHRKLPKTKRRCGSKGPPRGNTFHDRRAKGKACRRHSAVAPSKMLTISKLHPTTSSIKVGPLNVSKSKTLMTNKKKVGKSKSNRKNLSAPSKGTTNSYRQRSSTTNGTPSLTQKRTLQLHKTVTKSMKTDKKVPKRSHCCRSRMPLRGDTFWPDCKSCLETETTHDLTTVIPETTTNASPTNVTMFQTVQFKKITTYSMAVTAKPKTRAANKPQKQMDSYLLQANTSQEAMGSTLAQSSHAVRSSRQNNALRNMTDNQSTCESLKHLDECKYKIPPLEKKYDLHNMDSKTAYHCDCTSRLAVQFERFNQPSTLPMLLKDFVSQYCFKLPKGKKCHSRKRFCFGGFNEATDLLQKLKKEGNSTTGVHNSGTNRKRGTPVHLYKQCLRLEREADIMAQLTLL